MILLKLAWKSLRSRWVSTSLTVVSIALSVTLLLAVEKTRQATEDGFTQSISQVDLLVGARSGPIQLILFSVFNIGNPTHNISYATYEKWKAHPAVAWTIPYSLGDAHKGFRVVGTTEDFFKYYRFRGDQAVEFVSGRPFAESLELVLGAEVQKKLNYKLNDPVIVTHGVTRGEGVQHHADRPFKVVGILKPTGTALDRAVYISLHGMEALHEGWDRGAPPKKHEPNASPEPHHDDHHGDPHGDHIGTITSFFVRTNSRIETLGLQREINEYKNEALLAIIPAATLAELWHNLSYIESVLKLISLMVILVGFFAMLIALLTSLNERRREMAILRALGASPGKIFFLLIFESSLLSLAGVLVGSGIALLGLLSLGPWLAELTGLYFKGPWLSLSEIIYLLLIWLGGTLIGSVPATKALKNSLKDGLT